MQNAQEDLKKKIQLLSVERAIKQISLLNIITKGCIYRIEENAFLKLTQVLISALVDMCTSSIELQISFHQP